MAWITFHLFADPESEEISVDSEAVNSYIRTRKCTVLTYSTFSIRIKETCEEVRALLKSVR